MRFLSSAVALLTSAVALLASAILYLLGRIYLNEKSQESWRQAMEQYSPLADSQIDPYKCRPQEASVIHEQISGHRYGWFKGELYHVPLERGMLPMSRKRACRHQSKTLGALLLIHGFAQNRFTWDLKGRSLVNYLAEAGYDVFYMDLRGSRESSRLGAPTPAGIHEVGVPLRPSAPLPLCLRLLLETDMDVLVIYLFIVH